MTIEVLPAPATSDSCPASDQHSLQNADVASGTLSIAPDEASGPAQATGTTMATNEDATSRGLPSGLLTFVFTDIEASTRLYKVLGDQIAGDVFDLHNIHLRAAWDAFGGHEVHTEGDSFFVVFEDPNDAVAACVNVQERLAAVDWPKDGDVRVRIGVHCGLAAPRNNDYMALAVHQAARVMSAANGNQVLVTDAILQRLDPLQGATVARAGRYRLRDFDDAPTLYRIDSTSLTSNDHPPRATPANHHNLVPRLTSFVGRATDVAAVSQLLTPASAVSVAGLGGMGKTRLAVEVGLHVAPTWESGVWMVELAEVVDPELIAEEVASSIGVDSASVGDRWDDVITFVGDKALLLILDNVEHLIDDVATLVPRFLRACPNSAVLSTSREPLNCQGEIVYRLNPLDVAARADDPCLIPSVELFVDRARAVDAEFECLHDDLDDVLEICRHLDGLPLAIEIAAAQVGVLQLSEIRSGLSNRFRLLRSRDRALPERQRTMEGLLGWSYQLLTEAEQRAFRRLAVFGGSFHIDAAEAALTGEGIDADDVPELIWALVDKSLVTADLSDSSTRYRLLESVQQYAMRLLIDNDDPIQAALGLGIWLRGRIGPWLVTDRAWLGEIALELGNIRSVVDLLGETHPELGQQLVCSLARHHDAVQSYSTGIGEIVRAVSFLHATTPARVALLVALSELHLRTGERDAALASLRDAEELQDLVGSPHWDDVGVACTRGEIATRSGDFDEAIRIANDTLRHDLSVQGAARLWSLAGIAHASKGDFTQGFEALERSLEHYLELCDDVRINIARGNLAEAAWRLGDVPLAALHQANCLEGAIALGQQVIVSYSFIMASRIAASLDDLETAVRLQALAETLLASAGHAPYKDEVAAIRDTTATAERELGVATVQALVAKSRALPILEAADLANSVFVRAASSPS